MITTPPNLDVLWIQDMENFEVALEQTTNHPATLVAVKLETSDKPFKRQINAIRRLQSAPENAFWRHFLLGNGVQNPSHVNIYAQFSPTAMSLLPMGELNTSQVRALDMLRNLRCNMGLVIGPAATGKTRFIISAILPFLLSTTTGLDIPASDHIPMSEIRDHQLQYCTPDNFTADDVAEKIYDLAMRDFKTHNAIVIRVHSISTEKAIIDVGEEADEPDEDNLPPESDGSSSGTYFSCESSQIPNFMPEHDLVAVSDLSIAHMVYDAYSNTQERPYGVRDKRYKHHFMSLSTWMLTIAGITGSHPREDPEWHHLFVRYYHESANSELDDDAQEIFGQARQELREHTLSIANVVITTTSNAGDASVFMPMHPNLVVLDEAARVTEAEALIVIANYPRASIVMLGDHAQLRPFVHSNREQNPFASQLHVSLFHRLQLFGHNSVMFDTQYRMVKPIGTMVSKLFYGSKVFNAPATAIQNRPLSIALADFFDRTYRVRSPLITLNVASKPSKDRSGSLRNYTNADLTMNVIQELLDQRIIAPRQITIMSYYRAQQEVYKNALREYAIENSEAAHIENRTVDSMQGQENRLVFLDTVIADRIGFLNLKNRINISCSRGMDALVLIANTKAVFNVRPGMRRHLGNVFTHVKEIKAEVNITETPPNEYVSAVRRP